MKKTFAFRDMNIEIYSNEKIYNGLQYVTAKHGYQTARGTWDHDSKTWTKRLGNPEYDDAVARAAGFIEGDK